MSVSAVNLFYAKLASDQIMRKAFLDASSAFTMKFAAERGYMFTAHDLQRHGEFMHAFAKQFGEDVHHLHKHHVASAGKGVAAGIKGAAGAASAAASSSAAGMSPSQSAQRAHRSMSAVDMERLLGRIGDVVGHPGAKKKSGGG